MTVFLRLFGSLLIIFAGSGAGFAAAARSGERRQQAHTFARLLVYLAELLDTQAVTGDELLHRTARAPEFAAFCPPNADSLSALTVPPCLPEALQSEINETLLSAEESPRAAACAALQRLAALCEREADIQAAKYRDARRLWPKLGACLGAMAAILLW